MRRSSRCWGALLFASLVAGCGTPYSARDHITLTAAGPVSKLILDNSVGDIAVRGGEAGGGVRAELVRIGKGTSPEQAEEALQEITVSLEPKIGDAGVLLARAVHPSNVLGKNYEVRWTIVAPPDVALTIENGVGDLKVDGFQGAVSLRTDVGDTMVSGDEAAAGATRIRVGVGDVKATGRSGGLDAETDVGDIHAEAGGAIKLLSGVGDIHLRVGQPTAEPISVNSGVGDVVVYISKQQQGRLTADTDVGGIQANLDDMSLSRLRQRDHFMSATLGTSAMPTIDLSAGVGDMTILFHPGKDIDQ